MAGISNNNKRICVHNCVVSIAVAARTIYDWLINMIVNTRLQTVRVFLKPMLCVGLLAKMFFLYGQIIAEGQIKKRITKAIYFVWNRQIVRFFDDEQNGPSFLYA